jgi:hypothetical protein
MAVNIRDLLGYANVQSDKAGMNDPLIKIP